MGKLFIPFTKFPLSIGKSVFATALSKTLLTASTQYALDPTTSVELEGLTVEATGKATPAELTAILSGSIFTSAVIWGYKKTEYRARQIVFKTIERAIKLKQASMTQSGVYYRKIVEMQASSDIDVDDLRDAFIALEAAKEDAQVLESLLKMGEETQNLSKASLFNRKVNSGDFLSETIIQAIEKIDDFSIAEYEKSLKKVVDANLFWTDKTTKEEKALFSLVFDADDLLGYRAMLDSQITSLQKFISSTSVEDVIEASQMPRYDFEEATEEGRWLNKQVKEAKQNMALLDDVNDNLNITFDEYVKQQGLDPDTGKFLSKKSAAKWGARAAGRLAGYALWIDGVIWVGTVGIDLGLNLFLPEEEQGFFAERAGFSFVDEYVIVPLLDWVFGSDDVQQFLLDTIITIGETSETLQGAIFGTILWFIESFDAKVDFVVDNEATGRFFMDSLSESFQPEYVLVGAYLTILVAEVWKNLLRPSWAILTGSIS